MCAYGSVSFRKSLQENSTLKLRINKYIYNVLTPQNVLVEMILERNLAFGNFKLEACIFLFHLNEIIIQNFATIQNLDNIVMHIPIILIVLLKTKAAQPQIRDTTTQVIDFTFLHCICSRYACISFYQVMFSFKIVRSSGFYLRKYTAVLLHIPIQ